MRLLAENLTCQQSLPPPARRQIRARFPPPAHSPQACNGVDQGDGHDFVLCWDGKGKGKGVSDTRVDDFDIDAPAPCIRRRRWGQSAVLSLGQVAVYPGHRVASEQMGRGGRGKQLGPLARRACRRPRLSSVLNARNGRHTTPASRATQKQTKPTFFCPCSTAVSVRKSSRDRWRSALTSSFMGLAEVR